MFYKICQSISIEIQKLNEGELQAFMPLLAEIESGLHFSQRNPQHTAWLEQKIGSHLACGARFFGCQTETGEALGIVGIVMERKLFSAGTAEIVDIGVLAKHRRGGVGSLLLNHAVTVAKEEGAHAVFARTYAADTDAIAFYGRNAFYPVAVIPETNGPIDEGDIVMRRKLINKPHSDFTALTQHQSQQ